MKAFFFALFTSNRSGLRWLTHWNEKDWSEISLSFTNISGLTILSQWILKSSLPAAIRSPISLTILLCRANKQTLHTYTHTYIHTYMHTNITYIHTYIHTYIQTNITYIHTYIHTYIQILHKYTPHTHTRTQTYTNTDTQYVQIKIDKQKQTGADR